MDTWRVRLVEKPEVVGYDIYMYQEVGNRRREFITKAGKEIQSVELGDVPSKDVTYGTIQHEQLKALVDEYSRLGFKSDNDSKTEGKLEATKYHLEDMRALALKGLNK